MGSMQAQPKADGSIVIEAHDSLTRAPLQGVRVVVIRQSGGNVFNGTTGADGVARFTEAVPGGYVLIYEYPGYGGSADLGDRPVLRLGEGGLAVRHTLSLIPDGGIEGVVLDEEGKPFAGVSVKARKDRSISAQQGVTDAEGRFRIAKLRPADYLISARVPEAARRATLKRDPETGETFGYPAFSWYPGGWEPGGGVASAIPAGASLRGFDVRLRRTLLVSFTGKLLARAGGDPVSGAELELHAPGAESPDEMYGRVKTGEDGNFAFEMLTPGHYSLNIYPPGSAKDLPYTMSVDVGKGGVADRKLLLPPLQDLAGVIHVVADEPGARVRVAMSIGGAGKFREFTVEGPGEFTLGGIPPGRWTLDVLTRGGAFAAGQRNLGVASLRFGALDAIGGFLVSESGNPPLTLTLTAEAGRIAGRVPKDDGGRSLNVLLHRVGFGGVEMTPVKNDGTFAFERLTPGTYELVAVAEGYLWLETPKVSPFIRVEVKAGETTLASPKIASR
jgi:hypothetical protein